jgi:hypothetical protein
MTRKPAKRSRAIIACPPVPRCASGVSDSMELLRAARARGILSEEEFDLSIKLLLRRHGLAPAMVTKA